MTEPMAVDLEGVVDGDHERFRALFGAIDEGYCLCEMVAGLAGMDPGRACDVLMAELGQGTQQSDDIVVVVAEYGRRAG